MYETPVNFPVPQADGYEYNPVSPFTRTQMDSGRARHRRRNKTIATAVKVVWVVPKPMMAQFRYFFFDLVRWGFFKTKLQFDQDIKMMKARFSNAETPFSVSSVQNTFFKVTAELEVFELDLIDEATYLNSSDNGIFAGLTNPLHQLVNVEMPAWGWSADPSSP